VNVVVSPVALAVVKGQASDFLTLDQSKVTLKIGLRVLLGSCAGFHGREREGGLAAGGRTRNNQMAIALALRLS
jgi:hypothetical protein